jgi:hypothetical protein
MISLVWSKTTTGRKTYECAHRNGHANMNETGRKVMMHEDILFG